MAAMVVPCVFDAIFVNLSKFSPVEERIGESFKDLKEFHEFFCSLLQSLTDLSDSLNASSFFKTLNDEILPSAGIFNEFERILRVL
jgi:hypothetical protein